ncbi:MAG: hypothetical protein M1450_02565 [Patescibacteria group bacterium]|nr:hypothetical protein [Patescibacteria group bacterium]
MSGEPSGEGPIRPISPIRPDAVAREPHYTSQGVGKGPDFAPVKTPQQEEAFLRQRQSDWKFEDDQERIDDETERLYQLMQQEGKINEDPESVRYNEIRKYVEGGTIPQDKKFTKDLAEIVERDKAGEWVKDTQIGQPILKVRK